VTSSGENTIDTYLGDGFGGFVTGPALATTYLGNNPVSPDFNQDGLADLATLDASGFVLVLQ